MELEHNYITTAINEALKNIDCNGGPFGSVIVKNNEIIAIGHNTVTLDNDPTAHAEINAIRKAAKVLNQFELKGCILYSSCEPCPMCLSAIYWARIEKVYFALTREDAQNAGFDDNLIYKEIDVSYTNRKIPFINVNRFDALPIFEKWLNKKDKTVY